MWVKCERRRLEKNHAFAKKSIAISGSFARLHNQTGPFDLLVKGISLNPRNPLGRQAVLPCKAHHGLLCGRLMSGLAAADLHITHGRVHIIGKKV